MPVSTVMGNIALMMIRTMYAGKHFLFFKVTSLWHHNISDEPHKSLCGSGQRPLEKKGLSTLVFFQNKKEKHTQGLRCFFFKLNLFYLEWWDAVKDMIK